MSVSQLQEHPSVNLEFKNLCYSVRDTSSKNYGGNMKQILTNVSGIFKAGELTAIMGPSGAGKSTLLNILAGSKTSNVLGSVSVNRKPRDLSQFKKMSCYIMQNVILLPNLTIKEAMGYAARLKLPLKTTKTARELIIDEILFKLGLTECKNVRTVNISGGERKRLAIALELINNPPVMFFDEFSTGLDSSLCYSSVALLKALAQDGRTIIASIHQPSARILEQFDSLYLLGGGQCVYQGQVKSIVSSFAKQGLKCSLHDNPADFAIEVASGVYGQQWASKLSKTIGLGSGSNFNDHTNSSGSTKNIQELSVTPITKNNLQEAARLSDDVIISLITSINGNSKDSLTSFNQDDNRYARYCNEFITLLQRSFLCVSRDETSTHVRFTLTVMVSLLIGISFHHVGNDAAKLIQNIAFIFMGMLCSVFTSIGTTIITFPLERDVLIREHLNYWYSLKSYYMARTVADLPFQVFFALLYTTITYFMTEQPLEAYRFWILVLINVMISLIALSFGFLLGAACDLPTAVYAAAITSIPLFIFAGFGDFSLDQIPSYLKWVPWFSYPRHAFKVSLTAIYGFNREELDCSQTYCMLRNPQNILKWMNLEDVNIFEETGILLGFIVVSQFLAYWALKGRIIAEKQ